MAKDTKRKKLSSDVSEVHAEETMDTKVKKKRKKMEVEEAQAQISHVTIKTGDKKQKQKQKTKQTEILDPPRSCSEATQELEGEEDLSPEERRVLERKMKKILKKEEKKRLKAEGETLKKAEASGPIAPQQALVYLTCWSENRTEWKFQKTRQTWLLQHMFDPQQEASSVVAQHRRASSSGQDSAVFLHLKEEGHSFQDNNVQILDREDRWFERGVKEAIYVKIPDEKFSVLLEYLEGLRGAAKDTTMQKALALVEESGQAPEDKDVQQRAHRAREVIQLLS